MFFKKQCKSCEQLQAELHRQNENTLANLENIKELEAKNAKLHQELLAEREDKKKLLSEIRSLRNDSLGQNAAEDPKIEENSTPSEKGVNVTSGANKITGKQRSRKVRKPSKQSISSALFRIAQKKEAQLKRLLLDHSSVSSAENISDNDKARILAFIGDNASDVAEYSKYSGAPEDFGEALVNESRTWQKLVEVYLPKMIKSIEKDRKEKEYILTNWKQLKPMLLQAAEQNKANLLSNLRRALKVNEYGSVEIDNRDDEINRFLRSSGLFRAANAAGMGRVQGYIKSWAKREEKKISISSPLPTSGIDFEYWIADRVKEYGWEAIVSQASGDQGVDVVATKDGTRVAIQCKLYEGSVGNKAVQEILAGMSFFDLDRGAVISTGKFTRSARDLAQKNKVLLLSVEDIPFLHDLLK